MKKIILILVVLSALIVTTSVVIAEDVPVCGGLVKALEHIPPTSPGYLKVLEKAQLNCSESLEYAALVAFYLSTDGDFWFDNSGWYEAIRGGSNIPQCSWNGVVCSAESKVEGIILESNQLSGQIPYEIGILSNLTWLWLTDNHLNGQIPSSVGKLNSLVSLSLGQNDLTGPIPTEFSELSSIVNISLWGNELSGYLPDELGTLTTLRNLLLQDNQLTGPIPREYGQLTNLLGLQLNDNNLDGVLPGDLVNLSDLEILHLQGNNFSCWETPEVLHWAHTRYYPYPGPNPWDFVCP